MDIISEEVQHVKESRSNVCQLQELICVALGDDLNPFYLEQGLCKSKELPCLSYFL